MASSNMKKVNASRTTRECMTSKDDTYFNQDYINNHVQQVYFNLIAVGQFTVLYSKKKKNITSRCLLNSRSRIVMDSLVDEFSAISLAVKMNQYVLND